MLNTGIILFNDKDILKAEMLLTKVYNASEKGYYGSPDERKYFQDYLDNAFSKLEEIFTNRFGITIKFKHDKEGLPIIYPLPTRTILNEVKKIRKEMREKLITSSKIPSDKISLKTIGSLGKLVDVLESNSISIDIEELRFINGKDIEVNIEFSIEYMLKDLKLAPREILASFLHEIGHIFLAYIKLGNEVLYTMKTTYNLLNSIYNENDIVKFVKIYYKQSPVNEKDAINIVIKDISDHTVNAVDFQSYYNTSVDNEDICDYVAVKFGYSSDLASLIYKSSESNYSSLNRLKYVYLLEMLIITIFVGFEIALGFIILVLFYKGLFKLIGYILGFMFFGLIGIIFVKGFKSKMLRDGNTHRDLKSRIKQIRKDLISIIREHPDKKDVIEETLKQLKTISGILDDVDKLLGKTDFKDLLIYDNVSYLYEKIDSLINNELYVKSIEIEKVRS